MGFFALFGFESLVAEAGLFFSFSLCCDGLMIRRPRNRVGVVGLRLRLDLRQRWVDRIEDWRVKVRHSSGVDG